MVLRRALSIGLGTAVLVGATLWLAWRSPSDGVVPGVGPASTAAAAADGVGGPVVTADASGMPAWLLAPFLESFPQSRELVEQELQVLRLPADPGGEGAVFAWLALDRMNGMGVLFEPDGRGGYEPSHVVRQPVIQAAFDRWTGCLVLTVVEASGTGMFSHWFRILKPVEGRFQEVWRGVQLATQAGTGAWVLERWGSIGVTPEGPPGPAGQAPALLYGYADRVRYEPDGRPRNPVRQGTGVEVYGWDEEAGRFVAGEGAKTAGIYLVPEHRFAVRGTSLLVYVSSAARAVVGREGVIRLVDPGGRVVASQRAVPGEAEWLPVPADLAPGTYHLQLGRDAQGEAVDQLNVEVVG